MISIVIPLKYEKNLLFHVIEEISKKVEAENEILVIYDQESLFSSQEIEEIRRIKSGKVLNIRILKNKYGSGVPNAIRTGVEICDGDPVVFMTADLSDDPEIINLMLKKITEGFDIVCGSRFSKGGKYTGGNFIKKNLAKLSSLSLHHIIGIPTKDLTNTFKMFRKSVLNELGIKGKSFEWAMILTLEAFFKNFKISEVPCFWKEVRKGNFTWRYILNYIRVYIWAIIKHLKS